MESSYKQLNEEQRTELEEFVEDRDRGRAAIFVGRKAELAHVQSCINRLLRRLEDEAPGIDLTTVIQGAPGAGKSALLAKIAEDWPLAEKGKPAAIRIAAGSLKLPLSELLGIASRKAGEHSGVQRTLTRFRSLSLGVAGIADVAIGMDSSQTDGKPLRPVILLFDEIQTVLTGSISDQSREYLLDNLRLLHTGEHGAPVFPIYGGLANSASLLKAAGLTRLAINSEWTLPGFNDGEMDELMGKFIEQHLSSARPSPPTLERWATAFRRDSQGWPMHCKNFLIALCEQIKAEDWRPQAVNLDIARMRARQLRFSYYANRMEGGLQNRYVLISKVLEEMREMPPVPEDMIVDAIGRAHEDRPPNDFGRGSLPDGMTVMQTFEAMLHAGVIQKVDRRRFTCPIPSLASYIAVGATLPPSLLHEAVLDGKTTDIDHALNRRCDDNERAKLLQATDMRGRTPLILAIELGMVSVVEYLVQAESRLPLALRSTDFRDHSGRSAQDYASALDDDRMTAFLTSAVYGDK